MSDLVKNQLLEHCEQFVKKYPMDVKDFDAQEFFETCDEPEFIDFFKELYKILENG